eukprot:scaffold7712_cov119-Isochrysis_galbana.AAC.11
MPAKWYATLRSTSAANRAPCIKLDKRSFDQEIKDGPADRSHSSSQHVASQACRVAYQPRNPSAVPASISKGLPFPV